MKVLCIGHATYDFYLPVEGYPEENNKYRVENQIESGGGPAATAAYVLGKWGVKTYYHGVLGNDLFAKKILKEFHDVKVNTKYVERTDEAATTISFALINSENGSRTLFNYGETPIDIQNFEYDFKPNIILTDGYNYEASVRAIENHPDAITVLDAGRASDQMYDLARRVNYIVCSKEFAEVASGLKINYDDSKSLAKMYENIEKEYNGKVIITLEEKGCLYRDDHGKIKLMTGLRVLPKDTTSAGDIFHGAFVYGLSKGLALETCLKIANIAAGLSVTKVGSRNSVPELDEVHGIYKKNN